MTIKISSIKVAARIRKENKNIEELAADIRTHGLLNPITVTPSGGDYQLLAGLRRLRAAQALGWTEIPANIITTKDAEEALRIEISENEQREDFTASERVDYGRLLEEVEKAKAQERKSKGGTLGGTVAGNGRPKSRHEILGSHAYTRGSQTRDIIGPKVGMSGATYQRAKYVADNAPEIMEQVDSGEKTITGAYRELRRAERTAVYDVPVEVVQPKPPAPPQKPVPMKKPEPAREAPTPKLTDLQRAVRAEQELDALKYRQENEIYHRESIIANLKMRIAELETALDAANQRIEELEVKYESAQ